MPAQPSFVNQLAGKTVLIFGGSSGIGFGVAQGVLEEGGRVILASSSQQRIDDAIKRLSDPEQQYQADAKRVSGHAIDLSKPSTVEADLKTLFDKHVGKNGVDHIVYSAGDALKTVSLSQHTAETIIGAGQVRFVAPILVVKTAVYGGYLRPGGSVVITTGAVHQYPVPNWSVVAGYAGGLVSLVRHLAFDLSGHDVRINGVSPGPIKTEMWGELGPELEDKFASGVLTGRVGLPTETAHTYLALLKNRNINGTVVHDDGGSYAGKQERRE